MARFEIHNYGKNLHFPYNGAEVFLTRNHTERTDDPELARIAETFKFVGVVENKPELSDMSKKELIAEALKLGIADTGNKRKAELIREIESSGM